MSAEEPGTTHRFEPPAEYDPDDLHARCARENCGRLWLAPIHSDAESMLQDRSRRASLIRFGHLPSPVVDEAAQTEVITVPREMLQRLLDMVVGSMDYGSGFLETADVDFLRAAAVQLGVDPVGVTPEKFYFDYRVPLDQEELERLEAYDAQAASWAGLPDELDRWSRKRLRERHDANDGKTR